jgi:sRNA-binding regulator protein Hfq
MPMQMALAVAHGKVSLNEALERLARRDQVARLVDRHQISRALAMQVALGQVDLEVVLQRRRFAELRERDRNRSVIDQHLASGEPLGILVHGDRRFEGKVALADAYMFRMDLTGGGTEDVHKLQVKLAYRPDDSKRLRKAIRHDRTLKDHPISPIPKPQDRYSLSDKRLFELMDAKTEVVATLLEGEVLKGVATWFSRYEFGLALKGDVEVVVFRHALHAVKSD